MPMGIDDSMMHSISSQLSKMYDQKNISPTNRAKFFRPDDTKQNFLDVAYVLASWCAPPEMLTRYAPGLTTLALALLTAMHGVANPVHQYYPQLWTVPVSLADNAQQNI